MDFVNDYRIHADMAAMAMCTLLNENAQAVAMNSLWEKQPAIFVFLRHFACDACRRHAVDVWNNRDIYEEKGARIHFIGNGNVEFMKEFKKTYGLEAASFFTDPSLKAFQAAGFKKGFWIDPGNMHSRTKFLYKALRHTMKDPNSKYGNIWQLGGILVVKPNGVASYQFTSLSMGHFPPASDVSTIAKAQQPTAT